MTRPTAGCLPNIFSHFQGFQPFFLNLLAVVQGFLEFFLPVFKVLLKKFHQISTYRFRNFRTNLNIRRFSDTKMGDFCNKLLISRFSRFSTEKYLFFKVFKVTWSDLKVFKVFKVRQPPCTDLIIHIYNMWFREKLTNVLPTSAKFLYPNCRIWFSLKITVYIYIIC